MKTATLTLYYKSLLNKDKNFILDNPNNGKSAVENYLSTLQHDVITGFQYQKHQMVLTLKIDRNQTALNMGQNAQDLNYIKIQNEGENPKYYFIIGKNWKAENTIELVCNMDTLNSFEFNRDYEVNKKTLVKREHRDRFEGLQRITFEWKVYAEFGENSFFYTDLYLVQADVENIVYEVTHIDNPGQAVVESLVPYTNEDGVKGLQMTISTISYNNMTIKVTYTLKAFVKLIDLKSEEISAPLYLQQEETLFEKHGDTSVNWALYYKSSTDDENSPVECYLIPDQEIPVEYSAPSGVITYDMLPANGDYLFVFTPYQGDITFEVDGTQTSTSSYIIGKIGQLNSNVDYTGIAFRRHDGHIEYTRLTYHYVRGWYGIEDFKIQYQFTKEVTSVSVLNPPSSLKVYKTGSIPQAKPFFRNRIFETPNDTLTFSSLTLGELVGIQQIDRTDSKNIKIIDVPYSPSNYTISDEGNYNFEQWYVDNGFLKIVNTSLRFQNDVESNGGNVLKEFIQPVENVDSLRNRDRFLKDSKLSHSDYYRPKFVYDSFTKTFALEKMEFIKGAIYPESFNFTFVMTRNIVSKFLFKFNYTWKYSVEDYPNIVAVSRNNEEVLYNSQYINYLRTGYNYDLKAKQRQETSAGVGIGLSALGLVASIAVAVATENPLPVAGAIASGIGLVGQTINYAKTTAQNEDNIQRKLQEAQMQSVAVMNADDIDLLFAYAENRAKLCYYQISPKMQEILDDLFYYGGYITNEQKIPNIRTRYWFNFVQCSLIIEESNNLTEDIENDIKSKFENGVTFMHLRNGQFDLRQEKENMETSIVGG